MTLGGFSPEREDDHRPRVETRLAARRPQIQTGRRLTPIESTP
jgi:hypothetical protein